MKKIYYEKRGRRYVPVAEYDNDFMDSFTKGNHLVMSYPGGTSRRFNIDPNYAAMIAAGRVAEEAICESMRKASEMKPQRTPITPGQKKAWEKLAKEFGDELCPLTYGSTRDHAEAGVKAMQEEADKLMKHESVRKSYEHFLLMCELQRKNKMIKEFMKIVETAEGITDAWFKNGSFETYKLNKPVPYTIADSDGVTKTLEGPVEHRAGHYIMGPGPKEEFWPLDPDNFRSKYNDNNDGTATPKKIDKIAKLADHDGVVKASWGDLNYKSDEDYIVRHAPGDYGVVKKDIFAQTYEMPK